MLLLSMLACDAEKGPEFDPSSNLCGTVDRSSGAPDGGDVFIATVRDGETACVGGDTGGAGWWSDQVAAPALVDDAFEATVEPGAYGVEVTSGMYAGCAGVDVVDTSQCSGEVLVELGYLTPVDKPNLYLYPERATDIRVRIPAWKKITESEPRYPVDGWKVRASPDGRLSTKAGPRDYLFYELAWDPTRFQTAEGWCVPGSMAQATIEDAMSDMGFLPHEVQDFADAWDADFPAAEWMTVYPQVDDLSALTVDPEPRNLLRAWFFVADGCEAVIPPQLPHVERVGYHAAEWGIAFRQPLYRDEVLVEGWR